MKKYLLSGVILFGIFTIIHFVDAESVFNKDLYYGIQGDSDVSKLQEFLTEQNIYSGPITGNFFSLTLKAVKQFQTRNGISPAAGYFGPITRTKANQILSEDMSASEQQAILETGTTTATTTPPKTTNDIVSSLQLQLQALLQQVALLQQQQQSLQQIQQSTQQIQQNTQQIAQNTTPTPTPCSPNWQCGLWSSCVNGQQTRTCYDSNNCGTNSGKPSETQSCTYQQGYLNVLKSASSPSGNISSAANNIVLARFDLTVIGEKFDVRTMRINIAYATSNPQLTGTVSIKDASSGEVYASLSADTSGLQKLDYAATTYASTTATNLSSYMYIESGQTKTIEILGSTPSTATGSAIYKVYVGGFYGKRYATNDFTTLPNETTVYGANTLTVTDVAIPGILNIKKDSNSITSKIILSGAGGVELGKINFEAKNGNNNLILKKITLSLASADDSVWSPTASNGVPAKINRLYLYDGSTLLNTGGTSLSNGLAVISGINVSLAQDAPKILTVKADITGSMATAVSVVGAIKVYSNSNSDLEVYSLAGLMSSENITLTNNAQGNYMLFADSAPAVASISADKSGSPTQRELIGKFTVTNNGSRVMTLTKFRLAVTLTGGSTSAVSTDGSYVRSFEIYDDADTLLTQGHIYSNNTFSSAEEVAVSTSTRYVQFDFSASNTEQEIAANGGSKTFVVKADTRYVENTVSNAGQNIARVTSEISGSRGYSSTDTDGPDERYWNDGFIVYKYTPVGGSLISERNASDSMPVQGPSISY